MAQVVVSEEYLSDIAQALRVKLGTSEPFKPSQMANGIRRLPTAPRVISKNITANGTYSASTDGADGYSPIAVNVANSYTQSDEGKVVNSGALVSQSSQTITQNGTYNTTLNNQIVANVPNTYTSGDEGKVVSNGQLVAQTARSSQITENGTYDTTMNNEVVVNVSGGGGGSKVKIMNQGQISSTNDYQTAYFDSSVDFSIFNLLLFELYLNSAIIGKTYIYKEEWQQYPNFMNFIIPGTSAARGYQCRFSYNDKTIASTYYSGSYEDLYVNVYGVML